MRLSSDSYATGKDGRNYEMLSDQFGRRFWINADDGSAVARFNTSTGVDLHNTATAQMEGAPECLWCTHGKPDLKTWIEFIKQVKVTYGVHVPEDAIDIRLLNKL